MPVAPDVTVATVPRGLSSSAASGSCFDTNDPMSIQTPVETRLALPMELGGDGDLPGPPCPNRTGRAPDNSLRAMAATIASCRLAHSQGNDPRPDLTAIHSVIKERVRLIGGTLAIESRPVRARASKCGCRARPMDKTKLDLAMPGLPGLEVLRALNGVPLVTRTILLTANIERDEVVKALQRGRRRLQQQGNGAALLAQSGDGEASSDADLQQASRHQSSRARAVRRQSAPRRALTR